ncbi:sialate O-acetylesterase [Arthrobacter sp. B2a2-09]|uniref:sialate O-acetylesterase n=1 Tax=Arthrobacter sp. B2a2-09 TaxID=2952822 RepID=UPI0022CD4094|nr:sialate O-acetylesterase [Arthrobacter sp. B2a2-09]MCZ9884166.1 sialate O-acetylesterase [Arthrobacter sp. B2a2-09]
MGKITNLLGGHLVKPPSEGYDVFLIAGQSNALGAGLGHKHRLDRPHGNVHQFAGSGRKAGKVLRGEHPLWHHTRAPGVGFGLMFGKLHAEATGRPVLLVPAARGESGFHPHVGFSWDVTDQPGTINLYRFASQQLASALSAHPGSELRAILWHQGEADVWHLGQHEYAVKLDALITGFRDEFGTAPFILGQMSPDRMAEASELFPGYPRIDAAQRDTPTRVPLTAFVEAPHGLFNSPEDKLHFSAEGQRELGRRYYKEYRRLTARLSSPASSNQR